MKKQNCKIVVDLPRVGMCNCLYIWGHGYLDSIESGRPLAVYGWKQFHPGPWLRGDKIKRQYGRYFKSGSNYWEWLKFQFHKKFNLQALAMQDNDFHCDRPRYRVFTSPWKDWLVKGSQVDIFRPLRGHESLILSGLMDMLQPPMRKLVDEVPAPVIAIHIRRGDKVNETGRFVTPDEWFCDVLARIRKSAGTNLPATIFSDAYPHELEFILSMDNTTLAPKQPDVVDMFQISKAQLIVTSHESTFGTWAGYLSQAAIIMHATDKTGRIRTPELPLFEGTIDEFEQQNVRIPVSGNLN